MIADLLLTNLNKNRCSIRMCDMDEDEFGKDRVHINSIEALIKGGGTAALELVCKNSDDLKIVLSLNAVPLRTPLYQEPMPRPKLIEWYSRFGFKRVSVNRDVYLYMAALMVRYPRG